MYKRFFIDSLWVLIGNVGVKFVSFLSLAILARLLTVTDFALYSILLTISASIGQLIDVGVNVSLHRATAILNVKNEQNNIISFLSAGVLLNIFAFFIFIIVAFYNQELFFQYLLNNIDHTNYLIFILPLSILTVLGELPAKLFMGVGDFKWSSIRNLTITTLSSLIIIFSTIKFGIQGSINGQLIAATFGFIFSFYLLFKFGKKYGIYLIIKTKLLIKYIREILKMGFVMYSGNTLYPALANFYTIFLITHYLPEEQYAFTRVALSIASIFSIIPSALQPVTLSFLSSQAGNNQNSTSLQYHQIRFLIGGSFIFGFIVVSFCPHLINLLFGEKYLPGVNYIAIILLINTSIVIPNGILGNFMISLGRTSYVGIWSIIGITITVLTYHYCMPTYGVTGFLWGYSSGYIIGGIASLIQVCKQFDSITKSKTYSFFSLSSVTTILILLIISNLSGFPKIITSLAVIIFYIFLLIKYYISAEEKLVALRRLNNHKKHLN